MSFTNPVICGFPFSLAGSLVSKRGYGLHTDRSPGGQAGGQQRDGSDSKRHNYQGRRIAIRDPEELALYKVAQRNRQRDGDGNTAPGHSHDFAQDHVHDGSASRPESHANSNLSRALRNGVRQHTIQADRSNEDGNDAKAAGQKGKHALGNECGIDLSAHRLQRIYYHLGIDAGDYGAHHARRVLGCLARTNINTDGAGLRLLKKRRVENRRGQRMHAGVLGILDDAHNEEVIGLALGKSLSERVVGIAEELVHETLVHNDDLDRVGSVGVSEDASGDDRELQSGKVMGCYTLQLKAHALAFLLLVAWDV